MKHLLVAAALSVTLFDSFTSFAQASQRPRLVLQITVDQLRADLLSRYAARYGTDGLNYLLEQGVVYLDAHHDHANTETIVGHATLATGAHPAVHGMVGNVWYDPAESRTVYNIEDSDYYLLGGGGVDQETEVDPTQRQAAGDGRSPLALLSSTFADELSSATAGGAKVFAVSVKDRAAVAMAGKSGKAFWFSKSAGRFVTSSYYYQDYPQWVDDWAAEGHVSAYAGKAWQLMYPQDSYLFGSRDNQRWEVDLAGFGRTFPHQYQGADNRYYTTWLTISPAGDELTTSFVKTLLQNEQLGADHITDYLSVSYSSTDYVGHLFGPSSLEAEDNLLRLDRTLADLISVVDALIGLEHTLVVLSADHGAPEAPGYLASLGAETGYVVPSFWENSAAIKQLKQKLGIKSQLIAAYNHPYITLTQQALSHNKHSVADIERQMAEILGKFSDVAYAVPSSAIAANQLPDNDVMRKVRNSYHPARSGNIYLVFQPGRFIAGFDGLAAASSHGSPWRYDTHVPIVFAGFGLAPQQVARRVHTTDVAVTLAVITGTVQPSGAAGQVLTEVLMSRGVVD